MAKPAATPSRASAILSLLLVMLFWGSTFVVTKAAIAEIPPLLLATLRFVVASAILVPLAQARGGLALLPRPLPLGTLALMGLSGVTLFYVGFNLALANTTASAAALIQGATPAATAILAALFLGERLRRIQSVGIAVSILGVALIVLVGGGGAAPNPLLGDLLMLLAVVAWSVYTILGKRLARVDPLATTAYSSLLGTLFLLPFGAYDLAVRPPRAIGLDAGLAVLYLGGAASALAFLLWNRALRRLSAGQVANFINLVPLIGVTMAALGPPLGPGEAIAPIQLLGGALVLGGVWLSSAG